MPHLLTIVLFLIWGTLVIGIVLIIGRIDQLSELIRQRAPHPGTGMVSQGDGDHPSHGSEAFRSGVMNVPGGIDPALTSKQAQATPQPLVKTEELRSLVNSFKTNKPK